MSQIFKTKKTDFINCSEISIFFSLCIEQMMIKIRDIDMFLDFGKYVWQEIKINNFFWKK